MAVEQSILDPAPGNRLFGRSVDVVRIKLRFLAVYMGYRRSAQQNVSSYSISQKKFIAFALHDAYNSRIFIIDGL